MAQTTSTQQRRQRTPRHGGLYLGNYNICGDWGFGLAQAIWKVHIRRFDVMLLTNTKITSKAYCYNQLC